MIQSYLITDSLVILAVGFVFGWQKALYALIVLYVSGLVVDSTLDGAGTVRKFLAITVPGVRSVTTLVVVLATIVGANLFTEPYLLTGGGGPNGKSTSPVLLMYQRGIEQNHPDVASAIGVMLVIAVLAVAGIQQLLHRRSNA